MSRRNISGSPALTQERLKQCLQYDSSTGIFTRHNGQIAGTSTGHGYIAICVDGVRYYAHRLAWLYVMGRWPQPQIDHKNGIRDDNRWENLREASIAQQRQNTAIRSDNRAGLKGVRWSKITERYQARITVNGVIHILGQGFVTAEEAHAAYLEAKARLHTFNPTVRGLSADAQTG